MSFNINNIFAVDPEKRAADFQALRDTLPKEPSGDVKKEYNVGCFQKSDWEFIHAELMKDGSLEDNIPTDKCECINDCLSSDVRGTYLLTETEASELRANPKVDYVSIKTSSYPGTYLQDPNNFSESLVYRYASNAKHQHQILRYNNTGFSNTGSLIENPAPSSLLNRCSAQLYRHTAKKNPWVTNGNPQTIFDDRIYQYGTGTDIDLIVCDQSAWIAHMEFMNPSRISNIKSATNQGAVDANSTTTAPSNYVGGNVLKSGFATSATNGACDVLDLVLDAPYYIDPDFFEANSGTLTTRWDGTTVPTETAAKNWWQQNSTSYRSAKYVSSGNGGTATGNDDFGTVPIPTNYTRANCNGSHTSPLPNEGSSSYPEQHGTSCASQAYGRSHGWAYNANKWYLNLYGQHGFDLSDSDGFDIQKIFHQIKPNRASDNTKNPTISSNSWSLRFNIAALNFFANGVGSSGYYYYRPATIDGTTSGTQYTSWDMDGNTNGSGGTAPRFMTNTTGLIQCQPVSGAPITALNELISSGVIFCCAASNRNQKLVKSDHPDYNNYFSKNNNTALSSSTFTNAGITFRTTLNRPGYPGNAPGSINVGALDGEFSSGGKERKADYSSTGNHVDVYAVAGNAIPDVTVASDLNAMSLAASAYQNLPNLAYWDLVPFSRYDSFYTYNSSQSLRSGEFVFNGTSSACPITAGLIATKLETNRTWTYTDIKNWLTSTVGQQNTNDFYTGSESTTANDSAWSDKHSIQGGSPIVVWDAPTSDTTAPTLSSSVPADGATGVAVNANLVLNFSETVIAQSGKNIVIYKSDDSVVETISVTSGQVTGSNSSQITVNPSSNLDSNTSYYVLIDSASFKDAAGNSYAGISDKTSLNFTTASSDTTAPTLVSTVPATNATGVALNTNIVLNFSEAVIAQSGKNITIYTSIGSVVETISVTSGQVTGSGTVQITVNPASDLAANTTFYLLIDSASFKDAAGNSFAGVSDSITIRFTTGSSDTTNPTLVSTNPPTGATGVAVFTNVQFNFSEAVTAQSGNFVIYKASDNSVVQTISVTSLDVTGSGTSQITVNPNTFAENTTFYIHIDSTAFDDAAGNSFAGVSDSTTIRFTTGSSSLDGEYSVRFFGNGLSLNGQLVIT